MRDARRVKTCDEISAHGVDRNAIICHDNVHTIARCCHRNDFLADGRHAPTYERRDDDAAFAPRGRIRVSARSAAQHAVRAGQHIDVEVRIDFERREHDEIQLVHIRAFIRGVRVFARGDLKVFVRMSGEMFDRLCVKILGIEESPHKPLVHEIADVAPHAAERKAHHNAAFAHIGLEIAVDCERRAADTGLEGKSVLKIRGCGDDLRAAFRHHQIARILRDARFFRADFFRIADLLYNHDIVHVDRRDRRGRIRKRDERIRDDDDVIGIARISDRIAECSAVVLSARAVRVAVVISRRRRDKADIDRKLACLNRTRAPAVTADDRRRLELAGGNHLADAAAYTGGLDPDDLSLLDVVRKEILRAAERGRRDGEILQPHLLHEHLHDHARHIVTVAEGMMERDGHAVARAAFLTGFADRGDDLRRLRPLRAAHARPCLAEILTVLMIFPPVDLFAVRQERIRDLSAHCVFHRIASFTNRRDRRRTPSRAR